MLHHVEINVSNLGVSRAFWSEILSKLGYKLTAYWEEGFTLSNGEDAYLTFVQVKEKYASHNYNRSGVGLNHLAFRVKGRSLVDSIRQYCLYQPSQRVTDDRPIAVSDGHDFPGLIDEGVPGVAAVIDDVVEGFEDAVRQPVLAHGLPDIFLAVELGRARRQRQERDVARHLEVLGAVPAGLIEDDNRVGTRGDLGADLVEMKLHGFGVAGGQHEGGAGSTFGAYRTEQIGRLGALIVGGPGTRAFPRRSRPGARRLPQPLRRRPRPRGRRRHSIPPRLGNMRRSMRRSTAS